MPGNCTVPDTTLPRRVNHGSTAFAPRGFPPALSGDRAGLCGAVLSLCLHQLPPPPAEGYLPWCYRYLCAQLYPDGEVFDPALMNAVEEVYLPALCWALQHEDAPFDPLTDLLPLPEGAIAESRVAEEYGRFQALVEEKRLMALLRIGRECMPFDTASHIIGVHNVALHAAILARAAGLPVDLPPGVGGQPLPRRGQVRLPGART